jgi:formylglycine-generating enzyme required for sulfatase activity
VVLSAVAANPSWWTTYGVLDGDPASDYAVANAGQLKWMATQARTAMAANLNTANDYDPLAPADLTARVSYQVDHFSSAYNYLPVNAGQVKAVAKPFYNWLMNEGLATNYPWAGSSAVNYFVVNLGELKNLFSFPVSRKNTDGMCSVAGGTFQMGVAPGRPISVSTFLVDRYEVSRAQWFQVYNWAVLHGYSFDAAGSGESPDHPVHSVSWYDVAKWCNARSEREGRTPLYCTDTARTAVYRAGVCDVASNMVRWTENGYRLPTEAEWEKAARGGLVSKRYPWGDSIHGGQANYSGSGDPYETAPIAASPVGYYDGGQVPAGTAMANGFGLYDCAGNVAEWCWNWVSLSPPATNAVNPVGPVTPWVAIRVSRGGSWLSSTNDVRVTSAQADDPSARSDSLGFRCVRR